jgi:hypothetical protein
MGLDLAAVWASDAAKLHAAGAVIGGRAESMNGAMMLILGFYFAAPHMGKLAESALQRFGGQKKVD